MKPAILIVIGLIILAVWLFYFRATEGFDNALPSAPQTSMIPSDTPAATTTDPSRAAPQPKDVEATQESLKNFFELASQKRPDTTDMLPADIEKAQYYFEHNDDLNNKLNAALANSDAAPITLPQLSEMRLAIEDLIAKLRAARVVSPAGGAQVQRAAAARGVSEDAEYAKLVEAEPMPTTVAAPPGQITLTDLKSLRTRIQAEVLRLSNLRSTAATITARIAQLEKLGADLGDMISSVERGTSKIEDIPITPDSAAAFLRDLSTTNAGPIPPLLAPGGATPAMLKVAAPAAQAPLVPQSAQAMEKLLAAARDLRWSMEVRLEYDPTLARREQMLARVEKIVADLTRASIAGNPLPPSQYDKYLQEMRAIKTLVGAQQVRAQPSTTERRIVGAEGRAPSVPEAPNAAALDAAQGAGFGPQPETFPHGEISTDVMIRPGFAMNDEQIMNRASASAFNPAAVGGADYKQRAADLCRQIKSAQLGDAASFGCVANPDEVGPSYSWKGNYTMVCNRLGDSWGRDYPSQFGCPPYDPTARFAFS
jgi:hypothetical protein